MVNDIARKLDRSQGCLRGVIYNITHWKLSACKGCEIHVISVELVVIYIHLFVC